MSGGHGEIERAIERVFDAEPNNAFTVEDLCDRVYPGINGVERGTVIRAAKNVAQRRDFIFIDHYQSKALGDQFVFYRIDNVTSYAMARLKANSGYHYHGSNDERVPGWRRAAEKRLQADLSTGGRNNHLVVPGGLWHERVQSWIAELDAKRNGDRAKLKQVLAQRRAGAAAAHRTLFKKRKQTSL
jgi:hypothetical protein